MTVGNGVLLGHPVMSSVRMRSQW